MSHADSPAAPAPEAGPPAAAPAPVDWSEESTAGEEDPGASLDLALDPPPQHPPPDTPDTPDTPAPPGR